MELKQCFEASCKSEVEYSCDCTSPETYSCKLHLAEHLESSNNTHHFKTLFWKACKETKEMLLRFLTKEKSKQDELRKNIVDSFIQSLQKSKSDLEENLDKLDSNLHEINNSFEKVFQAQKISKSEHDPILKLLTLHPDDAIEKIKKLIPISSDFCKVNQLASEKSQEIIVEKLIQEKFESFLNILFKIEKTLGEYDKSIESNISIAGGYFSEINQLISELKGKIETSRIDLNQILWKGDQKNTQNLAGEQNSQIEIFTQKLIDKKHEILGRINDPEFEQDFRSNCSSYGIYLKEINACDPSLSQAYQEYISAYHQIASLYLTRGGTAGKTNLIIYDTESEVKETKVFNTPNSLNYGTCIAQLPNGELFCFGKTNPISGISLIIDRNWEFRELPSGTPCCVSSAIYFNRSVYCFGGYDNKSALTLSERFDLDRNQWIKLNPLPKDDWLCHCIVFKMDILISGSKNRNILRYSIENDSFTIIPFQFAFGRRKILVNAGRLYLIECDNGMIYESEDGDETAWKQVGRSIIQEQYPSQIYCSYNKEAIYIGVNYIKAHECYRFDLGPKSMVSI